MTPQIAPETPQDFIQTELAKFSITEAAIAEMRANYLTIKVADHTDKTNATLARSRRLEVKALRVETEKIRVALKADSLKFGKAVDAKAKSIMKPLEEIEAHLQQQEDIVTKHAEREAEKERQRIAAEQEAERKRLEAERQKLEQERAEIERQKAELERARKVNAERETVATVAAGQGYAESKLPTAQQAESSAPDLLEACKAVVENNGGPIDGMVDGQWIEESYVMVRREDFDQLCAAIAKAEGQ